MPVVKKLSEEEALAPKKRGRPKGSKNVIKSVPVPKTIEVNTPVIKKRGRPSKADAPPKYTYVSKNKTCTCKVVTGIKMLEVFCEHRNRLTLKP